MWIFKFENYWRYLLHVPQFLVQEWLVWLINWVTRTKYTINVTIYQTKSNSNFMRRVRILRRCDFQCWNPVWHSITLRAFITYVHVDRPSWNVWHTINKYNFEVLQRSTPSFYIPSSAIDYIKNKPIRCLIFNGNTALTINF